MNTESKSGVAAEDSITTTDETGSKMDRMVNPQRNADSSSIKPTRGMTGTTLFFALLVGIYFGIVLVKSEVVRWQRVHDMFMFREAHMYLIIGLGVIVAMISMLLIKRYHVRTIDRQPITYQPKPFHKGIIFGSILFGAGWAITGACPGPIYAQIGGGVGLAWLTLIGALFGMYGYALLQPKLPH